MKDCQFKRVNEKNSEQGLTVIELLIAMGIFLVVMSSVYGILKIGNMSRTTVNTRSENIKNVRLAMNSIGREAVNAGLGYNRIGGTVPDDFSTDNFGLPADADSDYDLLTAISAGNNLTSSDFSKKDEKNDVVAFAFRDFQFNDGFPIVINDIQQKGNSLVLKTPDGACANCRPYDLFLIETGNGRQAVILSTDIVNNNQIVLDAKDDLLNIDYGKQGKSSKDAQKKADEAQKKLDDAIKKLTKETADLAKELLKGDPKKIADAQAKVAEAQDAVNAAQQVLNAALAALGGGASDPTSGSSLKKCPVGVTANCIDYGSTSVVAKKIYLVSYYVAVDGTLIRTSYGNNTGETADNQILRQPIANGIRSFKVQYLLSDGTVTNDPSVGNTMKEKCNEIVQIEVTIVADSDTDVGGKIVSNPIVLSSVYSTRNIKYDVY